MLLRHRYLPSDVADVAASRAEVSFVINGTMRGWRYGFDEVLAKNIRSETVTQIREHLPVVTDIADSESSDIYGAIADVICS